MYTSEFCEMDYLINETVLLFKWLKFCRGEDYRNALRAITAELEMNKNKCIVLDARVGFEDEKEDAEWAFNEFIPKLAKTECKLIIFVKKEKSGIEEELDMFTCEFSKYFEVKSVYSLAEALEIISERTQKILLNVIYKVKPGKRDEFYTKVSKAEIPLKSRMENGCEQYDYYVPMDSENDLLLIEIWANQDSQLKHKDTEHFKELQLLKDEYITHTEIKKYVI